MLTGTFRLLGSLTEGYALGVLAQYKAEGFDELGGEAEVGFTGAARAGRFTVMGNLVAGMGLEEKEGGEVDGEAKVRVGYDVVDTLRLGAEGQVRTRLAGDVTLPGGRRADVIGGPQLLLRAGPLAIAIAGGPTTVGVPSGVAGYGMLTVASVLR